MRQLDIFAANSYHNTITVNGSELEQREAKAKRQEAIILEIFRNHRYTSFTCYELWLQTGQQWPITSVRRAVTNLSKQGHVRATGERRDGGQGVMVNCWIYNGSK